jgi:4-aminobutyrate aminotransferase-like enzyme
VNKARAAKATLSLLRDYESRNVTFIAPDQSWPIVWQRAKGVYVWDADGRRYLDLTAAFGVAAVGHAAPAVVKAGQKQMATLLHAMGDVHPHALKAQLARELSRLTFERWTHGRGKTIFCNSGFEAVEAALKTALLATGKPGVVAFSGAYHGLGYGALNATHRSHFRNPFLRQLGEFASFIPFPCARRPGETLDEAVALSSLEASLRKLLRTGKFGAVIVEPIQVRGGINIPPDGFLPLLRRLCDDHHALLILDEIYTGFGRTGTWFACEHAGVAPDLVCLGKAMTGGFPLSACVGRADVMDQAWPPSTGEAIHTSTFLGHPVGCAMALAQIRELEKQDLPGRSARLGLHLLRHLEAIAASQKRLKLVARGRGLLAGLDVRLRNGTPAAKPVWQIITAMLARGFILLPEGEQGNVISFTPPLTIANKQLDSALHALRSLLCGLAPR